MHQQVFGKILLFGEYSLLRGGNALSVPFPSYWGTLKTEGDSESAKKSNAHLLNFFDFIQRGFPDFFQVTTLKKDLDKGLYFDSNIPQGYGVGSSGALVAALIKVYGKNIPTELKEKQRLFGAIESHFHGKSSGLDVLVCFENQPILVKDGKAEICDDFTQDMFGHFDVLDSGEIGITSTLVEAFNSQGDEFFDAFDETYVKISDQCIEWLLNGVHQELLAGVHQLSRFAKRKMPFTIPPSIRADWDKHLESQDSAMKLCGSGGGGFALVYTLNP